MQVGRAAQARVEQLRKRRRLLLPNWLELNIPVFQAEGLRK